MQPGLVIFDCDGVLIDSEVLSARALIAELARHGVAVDLGFVARHFIGRAFPVIVTETKQRFGVVLPPNFEQDYRDRLLAAFDADLAVMAGAVEALESLAVPFCVATSSSPARLAGSLRIAGLATLCDGRCFTASEVPRGKPAPDLFLHAAARMGVEPAACVVIEDSAAGIAAALAAGMAAWRFVGGSHFGAMELPLPEGLQPHRTVASFAELRAAAPFLFRQPTGALP